MSRTMTRDDLDRMGCGAPDCTEDHGEFFLHARCHIKAGVEVSHVKGSKTIRVACAVCHALVADVAIATSAQHGDA